MGSQENLENVNDELAAVFANRRRRRRSATPVKIGGIVMGDENGEPNTEQSVLFQPFAISKGLNEYRMKVYRLVFHLNTFLKVNEMQ